MSFSIRRCPATVEMLDEHCEKLAASVKAKKRAQTEREVEELTRDTMQIQALFRGHNTTVCPSNDRAILCHDSFQSYPDRNLVDEEKREAEEVCDMANLYSDHLQRVAGIRDFTEM